MKFLKKIVMLALLLTVVALALDRFYKPLNELFATPEPTAPPVSDGVQIETSVRLANAGSPQSVTVMKYWGYDDSVSPGPSFTLGFVRFGKTGTKYVYYRDFDTLLSEVISGGYNSNAVISFKNMFLGELENGQKVAYFDGNPNGGQIEQDAVIYYVSGYQGGLTDDEQTQTVKFYKNYDSISGYYNTVETVETFASFDYPAHYDNAGIWFPNTGVNTVFVPGVQGGYSGGVTTPTISGYLIGYEFVEYVPPVINVGFRYMQASDGSYTNTVVPTAEDSIPTSPSVPTVFGHTFTGWDRALTPASLSDEAPANFYHALYEVVTLPLVIYDKSNLVASTRSLMWNGSSWSLTVALAELAELTGYSLTTHSLTSLTFSSGSELVGEEFGDELVIRLPYNKYNLSNKTSLSLRVSYGLIPSETPSETPSGGGGFWDKIGGGFSNFGNGVKNFFVGKNGQASGYSTFLKSVGDAIGGLFGSTVGGVFGGFNSSSGTNILAFLLPIGVIALVLWILFKKVL